MAEIVSKRLSQAAKDLNMRMNDLVVFLASKGHSIENKPTTKLTTEQVNALSREFDPQKTETQNVSTASARSIITANRLSQIVKRRNELGGIPKTIYKYYGSQNYHLESLEQGYLYMASPNNFNDPYDCNLHLIDLYDPYGKTLKTKSAKRFKKGISNVGVCCFSTENDSILLWSHYANNHKGFCLEFTINEEGATSFHPLPICYSESFTKLSFMREAEDSIFNMIYTKSSQWEYEKEWRIIDTELQDDSKRVKYFNKKYLKTVFIGLKCEPHHIERIKQAIRNEYPKTKILQAFQDSSSFKIVFKEISASN